MKILILNGPNLDLLGTREPERYGSATLADITQALDILAEELSVALWHVQSNSESEMLAVLRDAHRQGFDGAVINAAGFTHTSVVLRDALLGTALPFVEVHISNVHARESFRHTSLLADIARGVLCGFGAVGYELGLRGLVSGLRSIKQ